MSFNYNRVALAGNLTRDVEVKDVGTSQVANFSIAINERWKAKDGTAKESTTFLNCEAWGKTAQFIAQYFKKGDPIFAEGKIAVDTYEKDGQKQSRTKIRVENVTFCGSKKAEAAGPSDAGSPKVPAAVAGDEPPF